MKGTPARSAVDTAAAVASANKLTEATARAKEARQGNEPTKYVNLRFKAADYTRLKKVFGGQGFNITNGCRKAAVYIAELIEQGALTMTEGGLFKK